MREVVIAGYLRTAQTRSRPKDPARDWFHKIRSDELLAKLLPELIRRTGIDAREIDDFLVGSAMGVGEQWTYGGAEHHFSRESPRNDTGQVRRSAVRLGHGGHPYGIHGDRHRVR